MLHCGAHALAAMRDGDQFRVQVDAVAKLRRKSGRQTIVASLDPVHVPRRGSFVFGKLIDQRNERKGFGVGQKESAQSSCDGSQFLVGAHLVEPLGDRPASEVGGDWRVPPLLGEPVWSDLVAEAFGQPLPAAGRVAADDARLAGRVGPDVAEAAAQDPRQLEPELPCRDRESRSGLRRSCRRRLRRAGLPRSRRGWSRRGRPRGRARRSR